MQFSSQRTRLHPDQPHASHHWNTPVAPSLQQAASPTAKGFVFITMEDEDVLNDVFVRPDVHQRYYKVLRNCFLLIVEGTIQKQRGILNVLAEGAVGM